MGTTAERPANMIGPARHPTINRRPCARGIRHWAVLKRAGPMARSAGLDFPDLPPAKTLSGGKMLIPAYSTHKEAQQMF